MAWSKIAASSFINAVSGTYCDMPALSSVAAGDLVVALIATYDNVTVSTVRDSDGSTNSMTILTRYNSGAMYFTWAYKIGASAKSNEVFRVTFSGNPPNGAAIVIVQDRPPSGKTISLDVNPANANGSANTIASASFSTSGDDEYVIGGAFLEDGATSFSSELIAAGAADNYERLVFSGSYFIDVWQKAFTEAQSSKTAQVTKAGTTNWTASAIAFKAVAAAGGSAVPKIMLSMNQFAGGVR
jgi:hypothetical protein